MTFVSYAQNFEDVMLWRALKHLECGFYIDVGANDPSVDSVTKAFYERGWNGINIEPLPLHCADLRAQRGRDINLQCAVGAESGEIKLWEFDVRGWATASQDVVAEHLAAGHEGSCRKVAVRCLTEICEEHVKGDIHFLKIDVEGIEESVVRGMDFSRFRPWILVIEATKPNSTQENHEEWESIVLGADYLLAYFDGLNRFYVASEHSELLDQLHYPPNVFDDFIRTEQLISDLRAIEAEARTIEAEARTADAEARTADAEARTADAEARTADAEARTADAEARTADAEAALIAIYNSSSWRLTAPLRKTINSVKHILRFPKTLKAKSKDKIKLLLAHAKLFLNRRPKLRRVAFAILALLPSLERSIRQATMTTSSSQMEQTPVATQLVNLTPHARQIYVDLKAAIAQSQKEND